MQEKIVKISEVPMEQIYTIPVNEAFEASRDDPACGCPMCFGSPSFGYIAFLGDLSCNLYSYKECAWLCGAIEIS